MSQCEGKGCEAKHGTVVREGSEWRIVGYPCPFETRREAEQYKAWREGHDGCVNTIRYKGREFGLTAEQVASLILNLGSRDIIAYIREGLAVDAVNHPNDGAQELLDALTAQVKADEAEDEEARRAAKSAVAEAEDEDGEGAEAVAG